MDTEDKIHMFSDTHSSDRADHFDVFIFITLMYFFFIMYMTYDWLDVLYNIVCIYIIFMYYFLMYYIVVA